MPWPDPEDKDEYKAENVFFVPETARWSYLLTQEKSGSEKGDRYCKQAL